MFTMNTNYTNNFLENFYDDWSKEVLEINFNYETLALHFGYYTKGIKTLYQATLNMNDYVAELLHLQNKKNTNILDAGCGIGGSSIYLAKKYPDVTFTGINIGPNQVTLATKFAKERNAPNTKFILNNFNKTNFLENSFDGIFALESSCYAINHKAFMNEMYRILKPGGRLVIVDAFRTNRPMNTIMDKIYQQFCIEFGYANLAVITNFKQLLTEKGFVNVQFKDISKNVRRSILQWSIIAAPYYFNKTILKTMSFKRNKTKDGYSDYYRGNFLLA
jgi:tocopherol O-methyltransferase